MTHDYKIEEVTELLRLVETASSNGISRQKEALEGNGVISYSGS
jgi:hypothetical protein